MKERLHQALDVIYGIFKYYIGRKGKHALNKTKDDKGTIHVVMNGPSLVDSKKYIKELGGDIMMCNGAPCTDDFAELMPQYVCFADALFGCETEKIAQDVSKALKQNEFSGKVIISASVNPKMFKDYDLSIVNDYPAFVEDIQKKSYLLKKNIICPPFRTVAIMALYIAIQLGYSTIYLHGTDMNMIKSLYVDENNECYYWDEHFYNNEKKKIKNVYSRILQYYTSWQGFMMLKKYSDTVGVKIMNMSNISLVDIFDRYKEENEYNK